MKALKQMDKKKVLFYVTLIFMIMAAVVVCVIPYEDSTKISWQQIDTFQDWTEVESQTGASKEYRARLPQELGEDQVLCFRNYYMQVDVFLDGEEIYTYGDNTRSPFLRSMGNAYMIVELPKQAGGKEILVQLRASIKNGNLEWEKQDIYLDHKDVIAATLLYHELGIIIFAVFCLVAGLIAWAIAWAFSKREELAQYHGTWYLGIFIFLVGIWEVTDANILQFVTGNGRAMFTISFLTFMMMPIAFCMFLGELNMRAGKLLNRVNLLFMVLAILLTFAHYFSVVPFTSSLPLVHGMLVVTLGLCVWICWKECYVYHNKEFRKIWLGIRIFFVFIVIALLQFYVDVNSDYSLWFRFGILIFMLCLVYTSGEKTMLLLQETREKDLYKKLAYLDLMTGMRNRMAFDQEWEEKMKEDGAGKKACIVLDLNNLKLVNDTRGHAKGDELIKEAARCISVIFGEHSVCYRIGGDEFAVILSVEEEAVLEKLVESFYRYVEERNRGKELRLSIACGYCVYEDRTMDSMHVFREADRRMYENKKKQKAKRAVDQ